jgi:hypothetical protein
MPMLPPSPAGKAEIRANRARFSAQNVDVSRAGYRCTATAGARTAMGRCTALACTHIIIIIIIIIIITQDYTADKAIGPGEL